MHISFPHLNISKNSSSANLGSVSPIPLSFSIDRFDFDEVVDVAFLPIRRTVSKKKNLFYYLLAADAAAISTEENSMIAIVKAQIIDLLANEDLLSDEFERILGMASSLLAPKVGSERASYLGRLITHDIARYGPISLIIEDKEHIEEIEINSPTFPISVYHTKYGRCTTNLRFNSEEAFRHAINKMIYEADEELSDDNPIIDAQVKDARVHAQIKPYATNGATATIRMGWKKGLNLSTLLKNGTLTSDVLAYLWMAIDSKENIVISGAPASGKTTLLIALLSLVPRYKRVITIEEDVNELKFYSNVDSIISLYGSRFSNKVSVSEQAINALRLRPDLLVIGEIRGNEARDLFSGTNIGIPFMTTMHSNDNGLAVIKRLTTRPMGVDPNAISALDISIYMKQDGIAERKLSEICEYKWLSKAEETESYIEIGSAEGVKITNIVENGALNLDALPESKTIAMYSRKYQISIQKALKELSRRKRFIEEELLGVNDTLELLERIQNYPE